MRGVQVVGSTALWELGRAQEASEAVEACRPFSRMSMTPMQSVNTAWRSMVADDGLGADGVEVGVMRPRPKIIKTNRT